MFGIKSQRVVREDGVGPATVVIEGERIKDVLTGDPGSLPIRDVGSSALSPGLVDTHVHLNEPGRTEWEGFAHGTRAAAAGGVTTLIDMPLNSIPVVTDAAALELKVAASEGQRWVDVGFWGGVVPYNVPDLLGLARAGALGCKTFLSPSGIDEFPETTRADLEKAMPILRDCGLPLLVHAELEIGAQIHELDRRKYQHYLESRPRVWEDEAIKLVVELVRATGCHAHIVHLSSSSSLETLRRAKDEGLPISAETCPHYLCLDAAQIPDGATQFKCAPPIRERENRELLWRGLFDGVIDFVVTDHSPCTPGLKRMELGEFDLAWGGIASLSMGLAAVWTEASKRGATLAQIAHWMSVGPAKLAGLRGKGRISPGYDADLVVWQPESTFEVNEERLFTRHPLSPYLKRRLQGEVKQTFVRGRRAYADSTHVEQPFGLGLLQRGAR
ncbi:MAG TPA: allantoinase AllB [Polyangiales bacterium]|nr:allantoinase AllB [Polyangiales bacterium]